MTDIDKETDAAVEALVYRLRNRGPEADDEPFAREYVLALRARGWRPTEARRSGDWRPAPLGTGAEPGEEYRLARAAVEAKAAEDRHRLGHDPMVAGYDAGDAA